MIRVDMQSKAALRRHMLAQRQGVPERERIRHEGVIIERIRSLACYTKASTIALYMPIRGEVDLLPLWRPEDKQILFPKVLGGTIAFSSAATREDFTRGSYGILEPTSDRNVEVCEIDLILVPGVAFDRYGHRLGYGKGYYDRLIMGNPGPLFIGVCLDEFCIHKLPVDPWDARVSFVVTQAGIYKEGEV